MSKARDLANAGTALGAVTATELGYVDGVTSAIQTQIDAKAPSSTAATLTDTQTLTNKTIDTASNTITGAVTLTGTQTLTNKTLTNPVIASVVNNTLTSTTGDMIYASAANTPARLAIGSTDQVLKVTGGIPAWSTPATGATTWTFRQGILSALNCGAYNGSNLYVVGGSGGLMYTSPDGITWTSRTSGFGSNAIYWITYGNALWVAVGDNGTITTSTDGITWTARTSNMSTNSINHVVYANSLYVAVGRGGGTTDTGGIIYSTDGITWTRKSQSLTINANYTAVSYNGTNWIVTSGMSTNNYLYASTPSGTWTAAHDGSSGNLGAIWWDGTRNIIIGSASSGSIRYSTSATLGTTTAINNISGLAFSEQTGKSQNLYYNNRLYLATLGYITDVSTTPTSTNFLTTGAKQLSPGGVTDTSIRYLFVGAIGQIITVGDAIYTSF